MPVPSDAPLLSALPPANQKLPGSWAYTRDAGVVYSNGNSWTLLGSGGSISGVNFQTGTAYTLISTDAGGEVRQSNASANTITVPPNASVAYPVGTGIILRQGGVGTTTVVAGGGVTLNVPSNMSLVLPGQEAEILIRKTATDTWDVSGGLALNSLYLGDNLQSSYTITSGTNAGGSAALSIAPAAVTTGGGSSVSITAGQAFINAGGAIIMAGGTSIATTGTGTGGSATLKGGNASSASTSTSNGGAVTVIGGNGGGNAGTGNGGFATLGGGAGSTTAATGTGGSVIVTGGNGNGLTTGGGGTVTITAGNSGAVAGTAGNVAINGGSSAQTNGNGGNITLTAGAATGSGIPGTLKLAGATAESGYSLQVPLTGFSITIANGTNRLILNPAGTLATGTITMPPNPADGQIVTISSTQTITALTLSPNTAQTISNAASTLAPGPTGAIKYIYVLGSTNWFPTT